MRHVFVAAALLCGLLAFPSIAVAHKAHRVKMVQTVVGISATDRHNRPLVSPDGIVQLIQRQFGNGQWPPEYWARMALHTDTTNTSGRSAERLVPTRFPVDSTDIHLLVWYAKVFSHRKIKIGFLVLDGANHPLRLPDGVRITISQIGEYPWPDDLRVVIEGEPDAQGSIVTTVNFPLEKTVVKNLVLMAKTKEP